MALACGLHDRAAPRRVRTARGPLDGTPDVLLIARANDADEIRARLADDSWTRNGLLRITQIVPWTLRLGTLGPS